MSVAVMSHIVFIPGHNTPREKTLSGLQVPFQAFKMVSMPSAADMAAAWPVFETTAAR